MKHKDSHWTEESLQNYVFKSFVYGCLCCVIEVIPIQVITEGLQKKVCGWLSAMLVRMAFPVKVTYKTFQQMLEV